MIGILLIFFIGKYFYKLAEQYEKNKWGYGILGVVSYYAGTMLYGLFYGIIYFSMYPDANEDSIDDLSFRLIAVVVGIVACVGLYFLLERNWKKNKKIDPKDSIDSIGSSSESKE
ncbi:MAG: hypothetical protein JXQ93_12690 [Flavobacteriaceae bacterium]